VEDAVGTDLVGPALVVMFKRRLKQDELHALKVATGAYKSADVVSTGAWHVGVREDEIGLMIAKIRKSLAAVVNGDDFVTLGAQNFGTHAPCVGVVVG
jgi:hypothetical protein